MRIALGLATVSTLAALALPARAQCQLDSVTTDPNDRTCYVSTTILEPRKLLLFSSS